MSRPTKRYKATVCYPERTFDVEIEARSIVEAREKLERAHPDADVNVGQAPPTDE